MEQIEKLIQIAQNEVGYLEKKSNCNLDDKTANAGSNNYTKYWRDVKPEWQGLYWCACFVTWCFDKVVGQNKTKEMLYHYPYVYCPTLYSYGNQHKQLYEVQDCRTGDIAIFHNGKEYCHTGIVIANNGTSITTIEGNTSGGSSVVANGGGVAKKTYTYTYIKNAKPKTRFFRPKYESEEIEMTKAEVQALIQEAVANAVQPIIDENNRQNEVINQVGVEIQTLQQGHEKQNDLLYEIRTKVGV